MDINVQQLYIQLDMMSHVLCSGVGATPVEIVMKVYTVGIWFQPQYSYCHML